LSRIFIALIKMIKFFNKKFIQGVFLLSGTIIGVGMFGIPFVFSKAGFIVGAMELLIITAALTVIHLAYGEILLRTDTIHRLPGYVNIYFGKRLKFFSSFSYLIGLMGALLVYIVIGGKFLNNLLNLPNFGGEIIFWAAGTVFIFFSIRQLGLIDTLINTLLVGFLAYFVFGALPYFREITPPLYSFDNVFLPYGVLLFSLAGATAVPEVRALVGKNSGSLLKFIIIFGTVIPAVLYFFFALSVAGVSGINTSPDALSGVMGFLPSYLLNLGMVVGILAAFTSFIVIGLTLKETLYFDFGMRHWVSWAVTSFFPLLLFVLGVANFIVIIGFLGAVTGGIDAILTLAVFQKAKKLGKRIPEYSLSLSKTVIYALAAMFILGIGWEIMHIIRS